MERPSSPEPANRGRFRFFKRFRRRRVRYVAILPTLLTLGNGVCGFLALLAIAKGVMAGGGDTPHFHYAGYFILVGMVFDALDGKVARMTRTTTSFGAQMDSLCDLVTFGIAPAFLVYAMNLTWQAQPVKEGYPERIVLVVSVFYAMCALMRLARFTVETAPDEKSHQDFSGLPSPGAAGVVASSVIPWHAFEEWPVVAVVWGFVLKALPIIIFFLGVLMVSRIRYVHMVNRIFHGFRPFVRLVEFAMVALLVVIFHEVAIFLAFLGYALTGPVLWARARLFPKPALAQPPQSTDTEQDRSFF